MKIPPLFALAVTSLLVGSTARAEGPEAYVTPDYIRQPPSLPPGRDVSRAVRLTLAQAIEATMRRNLNINLEREHVLQAGLVSDEALGQFEPSLTGGVDHADSRTPPQTAQEGDAGRVFTSKGDSWRLGVSQPLPTGGRLSFNFFSDLSNSTLGTAVLPQIAQSSFNVTLSQPLLRGFSFDGRVPLAQLLQARFGSELALEQARLAAMTVVNATEIAYWNLVRTIKSYEVSAGALELARKQLELTQRQIAAGTSPGSDLIGAEATLAKQQLALVQADAAVDQVSDALRALLNPPAEDWDRPILPVDIPRFLPAQIALAPAIEHALVARPELKSAHIDLKQVALALDLARNARLPGLDLQARYTTIGQDQTFGPSFDQLTSREARILGIGLSLSWAPLGIAARARIHQMESALRGNAITREQMTMNIRKEVRQAVRDIDTADRRVRAAARSRELSERSLDVEQRRFLSGLSDNFKIAQRQGELEQARQAELDALIQHETAAAELQFSMGDLLESRRLHFTVNRPGSS